MKDKTRYVTIKEENLEITNIPCKMVDGEEVFSGKVMLDLVRIKEFILKNKVNISTITYESAILLIHPSLANKDTTLGIEQYPELIQKFIYDNSLEKNQNYFISATVGKGKTISAIKLSEKFIRENPNYNIVFITRELSPVEVWKKYSEDVQDKIIVKAICNGKIREVIEYNKELIYQITDTEVQKDILFVVDYSDVNFLRITKDIYNFNLNPNINIQFLFVSQKNSNVLNPELELIPMSFKDIHL